MMLRRSHVYFGLFLIPCLAGCGGRLRPPRVSIPVPERPEVLLRANLERVDRGDAVINEDDGLSPDEAAFLALERNPKLRAARARRCVAQAEIIAAGLLPNPRLEGSLSSPTAGPEARVLGYGAGLAWNITPLLTRSARVRAAEQQGRSVDLDVAWKEWQVAQSARLRTIRLIYLIRESAVAQEAGEYWQGRLHAYRGARTALAATELQVARALRSQAEWQLTYEDLERQQIGERSELALALGLETSRMPTLQTGWRPRVRDVAAADLLDALVHRRLDLIALHHAQRSHDEALRAATLARFPPVEIGVRTSREVDRVQAVGFAVSLSLPLFDRNQGEVAREAARQREVGYEVDSRLARARSQVNRYVEELSRIRDQLASARAAESAAVQLAVLARTATQAGALDPALAADSQDSAYQARLRTLRIEESYAEVQVALSLVSGTLVR